MNKRVHFDGLIARATVLGLTLMLLAVFAANAQAQGRGNARGSLVGNVYVMENDPEGNSVAVFGRFSNGKLKRFTSARTGGLGAGDNAEADPLGGQDSMVLSEDGRNLYVVNAGSDSISVFRLTRLGKPILIQQVDSNGIFPVSLSLDGDTLYVLNAGGDGTIAGYRVGFKGSLELLTDSIRGLDLGGDGIPVGDARNLAPGDISFDTLNRRLLIAFAGGGTSGQLLSFAVDDDDLPAATPVIVASEGAVPFSVDFTPNGTALIAEAAGSVSSYNYIDEANLETVSAAVANGQLATCWVQATDFGIAYTSNTNSGTLTSYRVSRNGELSLLDADAGDDIGQPIDFALTDNSNFLYVVASSEGGVRGFRVNQSTGALRDIGLFEGLPSFAEDGFAPQGLVIR